MAPTVIVFELQSDKSVKKKEVTTTFPWSTKERLCIITTQNLDSRKDSKEKSFFQYGVSTKVFAVTDKTGKKWEVCLLLSPGEVSRLSSFFHLTGFANTCLASKKYLDLLALLGGRGPKQEDAVREICVAAARFLCLREDLVVSSDYTNELYRVLNENVKVSCIGTNETSLVAGTLVALVAAELAVSVGASEKFDRCVKESQEDQREQMKQMIQTFGVEAELLTVTHLGKRMHIILRNPCPDNWASGSVQVTELGDTLMFGMCHKVLSLTNTESEIQFLQSLQETYDMASVFHVTAFVEHLLKVSEWRDDIRLFLKEESQKKDIINKLSHMAVRFVCSEKCQGELFRKWFRKEMWQKWSTVESISVGWEVICTFAILVAVLAALTAKSIADGCKGDFTDSEDEKIEVNQDNCEDTTNVPDVPKADVSPSETSDASTDNSCERREATTSVSDVPHTDVSPSETSEASTDNSCVSREATTSVSDVPHTDVSPSETSEASTDNSCVSREATTSVSDVPHTDVSPRSSTALDASTVTSTTAISTIVDASTNVESDYVVPEFSDFSRPRPEGTTRFSNAGSQEVSSTLKDPMRDSTEVAHTHSLSAVEDGGKSTAESPSNDTHTSVGIPATGSDMTTDVDAQTVAEDALEATASTYEVSNDSDGVSNVGIPETSDVTDGDSLIEDSPGLLTTDIDSIGVCDNGRPEPNIDDSSVLRRDDSPDDNRNTDGMRENRVNYPYDPTPDDLAKSLPGPDVSGDAPLHTVEGGGAHNVVGSHGSVAGNLTSKEISDSHLSPLEAENSAGTELSNERKSASGMNAKVLWLIGVILIILSMVLNTFETSSAAIIAAVTLAIIFWASRRL